MGQKRRKNGNIQFGLTDLSDKLNAIGSHWTILMDRWMTWITCWVSVPCRFPKFSEWKNWFPRNQPYICQKSTLKSAKIHWIQYNLEMVRFLLSGTWISCFQLFETCQGQNLASYASWTFHWRKDDLYSNLSQFSSPVDVKVRFRSQPKITKTSQEKREL